MKTATNTTLRLCERLFSNLSFWPCWPLGLGPFSSVARRTKSFFGTMTAHVYKEVAAGLAVAHLTLTANGRIYLGLVLMGVVSPLAACAYLMFDPGKVDSNWYHLNYFHLFYLLGPHLFQLLCLAGVFMLFPRGSKRAYLISIPAGYVLAKILWLIHVSSNAELWRLVPASFILGGMAISAVILWIIDWLSWRQFHGKDSFDRRLKGLYQIADDVPADKWKSMVMETMRNKFEFNTKY